MKLIPVLIRSLIKHLSININDYSEAFKEFPDVLNMKRLLAEGQTYWANFVQC